MGAQWAGELVGAPLAALFILITSVHLAHALDAPRNHRAWFVMHALLALAMVNMLAPFRWVGLPPMPVSPQICILASSIIFVVALVALVRLRTAGLEAYGWTLLALDAVCTVWMYTFVGLASTIVWTLALAAGVVGGAIAWLALTRSLPRTRPRRLETSPGKPVTNAAWPARTREALFGDRTAVLRTSYAVSALGMAAMLVVMSPVGVGDHSVLSERGSSTTPQHH
jgi:hypothetical protein